MENHKRGIRAQIQYKQDLFYLLIVGVVMVLFYHFGERNIRMEREMLHDSETDYVQARQTDFLYSVNDLINHIDGTARERVVAEAIENPDEPHLKRIEETFTTLLLRNPSYRQARWIDRNGREMVRVDQHNRVILPAAHAELQDKSGRYYTRAGLALAPGQFYTSLLDLNMEQGKVVKPYEPTLRIVRRLAPSSSGADSGFFIINVDVGSFIERLLSGDSERNTWLINQQGEWLLGPNVDLEWSFMFNRSAVLNDLFPGALAEMGGRAVIQFGDRQEGLLTAVRVDPVSQPGVRISAEEHWYIVKHMPAVQYRLVEEHNRDNFLRMVALVLVASGFIYSMMLHNRKHDQDALQSQLRLELAAQHEVELQEKVDQRTAELQRLAGTLEERVNERTHQFHEQQAELERMKLAIDEHAIVSTADADGNIIHANDRFCEISGYSRGELLGQNHRIVKSDEQPPVFYQNMWDTITSGRVWQGEVKNLKKGGKEYYWVRATIVPFMDESGKPFKYVSIRTDLTRIKQAEEELIAAKEAAEAATEAKSNFLASMSHELRTPLTAIIGNSELLSEQEEDPEHRELIRSIEVAGRSQLALVNDILDMSKIESGKFTIDEMPYDLNLFIRDLKHIFLTRAHDAGLKLDIVQTAQPKHLLIGDSQRIGQVLINLLGNAIKFTEQGSVTLVIAEIGEKLQFIVEDTGIGMTPEVQSRLFQRFEQANGSISRRFGGSGLGLYISHNLVELMGGEIHVESELDQGSRFIVTLPWQESSLPVLKIRDPNSHRARPAERFSGNVLIAEDTPELQLLERRILESVGVTATIAHNGEEAVVMSSQQQFDLILMDMQMPIMDGIEATRSLRAQGCETPIIALTANVMQKHRDAFDQAGCNGFLAKPVDKQELQQVLRQYLPAEQMQSAPPMITAAPKQKKAPDLSVQDSIVDEELMAVFMEGAGRNRQVLQAAFDLGDWKEVHDVTHTIKGNGSTFGYPELTRIGQEICDAIDAGEEVPELVEQLLDEMEQILP